MNTTVFGLIGVFLISTITGWFFSHTKEAETPVKVMLFVFYFWLFVFIQLIIIAVLYEMGLLESLPNNLW